LLELAPNKDLSDPEGAAGFELPGFAAWQQTQTSLSASFDTKQPSHVHLLELAPNSDLSEVVGAS